MFARIEAWRRVGRVRFTVGLLVACAAGFLAVPSRCLAWGKCCPPPYVHHSEGPPKIKWKCDCPRPVCPPCDSEWFGYYPTCWRPWGACSNCPSHFPPWVPKPMQPPMPPLMAPEQGVAPGEGTDGAPPELPSPQPSESLPRIKPTSVSSMPGAGRPQYVNHQAMPAVQQPVVPVRYLQPAAVPPGYSQ